MIGLTKTNFNLTTVKFGSVYGSVNDTSLVTMGVE